MPEQTILQGELSVGPAADGTQTIVVDVGGGRTYVVPLPRETAQIVGKALLAPRVTIPDGPLPPSGVSANGGT